MTTKHTADGGGRLLAAETSPYLLQHADNPVHWHPWGAAALAEAQRRNLPILLSIGYSACHWCHVMAHESFEDEAIAALMNEHFINIKVDREERPDLDRIYQLAHQAITRRSGGWPLTMFLDPRDRQPFFGGTYFPNTARHGLPGFGDLLLRVAGYYREHGLEVAAQGRSMAGFFASMARDATADESLDAAPLAAAETQLLEHFDANHGGFSAAPKFPHASNIARCLRGAAQATDGERAAALRHAAELSLERMAEGGLYDHLGGGFCRYSVDERWMIPHFEKMLYDNAALLPLYADWHASRGAQHGDGGRDAKRCLAAQRVAQTADWLLCEMRSPQGGFYSALDADSEGEEGRYYLWTRQQLAELVDDRDDRDCFAQRFGLDRAANFEGRWHLHGYLGVAELATRRGESEAQIEARLARVAARLFAARQQRPRPALDDKQLAAWNGMAVAALARAGLRLQRSEWIDAAAAALDFVRRELWRDGRLRASYRAGRARHAACLDDYAFALDGALALLEARWDGAALEFARQLAEVLLEHFEDAAGGGFYFTADDHEQLIHRPMNFADEALPSGNAIACRGLLLLGWLCAEPRYLRAAERALLRAMADLRRLPAAHCSLLDALQDALQPPTLLILRAAPEALADWRRRAGSGYRPGLHLFAIPSDAATHAALPAALAEKAPRGELTAYPCRGNHCEAPLVDDAAALTALLEAGHTV